MSRGISAGARGRARPSRGGRAWWSATALLVVAVAGAACDGGTDPDDLQDARDPGALHVVVSQVPSSVGGVLLEIQGDDPGTVTALAGHRIWQQEVESGRVRVLVRGEIAPGAILGFEVPDRNAQYSVTVIEGAAGADGGWARQASWAYQVEIVPGG